MAGAAPAAAHYRWVAEVGIQAAEGLAYAHQRGVIHRDIKPSNLLLDDQGVVWITDFGLARRLEDVALTHSGTLVGTPRYMSPEQAEAAARPVDHRTDIYSLGATLYEVLARKPAFDGRTPQEVVLQILQREPVPPRRLDRRVPRDLETIILKAMAKPPEDRYPTAADLAEDLRRFLRMEPIKARRIGPVGRLTRWARRNPVVAALTGLTVLATLATLVVGLVYNAELQAERQRVRDTQAGADRANEAAQRANAQAGERLGRANLAAALRHWERAEWREALCFFAEAVRVDTGDPRRAEQHRMRFQTYLRASPRLLQLWQGKEEITDPEFSPDGKFVAAGDGNTVRIWEVATGKAFGPLPHAKPVEYLLFNRDGRRLLTACKDRTVRVWDVPEGTPVTPPLRYCDDRENVYLEALGLSPDGRRVLVVHAVYLEKEKRYGYEAAKVWTIGKSGEGPTLMRIGDQVRRARLSLDGERVLTLQGREARLWDAAGRPIFPPWKHDIAPENAIFSPDGRRAIVYGRDLDAQKSEARVWDLVTGQAATPPLPCEGQVSDVEFSNGGRLVAIGSYAGKATVWDPTTGRAVTPPLEPRRPVQNMHFSPDGRFLLTTCYESQAGSSAEVHLWEVQTGKPFLKPLLFNSSWIRASFSPDGRRLLTYGDGFARVWDPLTRGPLLEPIPHVSWASFSPDGRRLLTVGSDRMRSSNEVRLWDLAANEPQATSLGGSVKWRPGDFSEDGRSHFWLGPDHSLHVADSRTGQLLYPALRLPGKPGKPSYVGSDPTGRYLIVNTDVGPKGQVRYQSRLYLAATGEKLQLGEDSDSFHEISPDGRRAILEHGKEMFALWELEPSRRLGMIPRPSESAQAEFIDDGSRIVTWQAREENEGRKGETEIRLWDANTVRPLSAPLKFSLFIPNDSSMMSRDGSRILILEVDDTGDPDRPEKGSFRVWDVLAGRPLSPLVEGEAFDVRLSPDGTLVLGSYERTVEKGQFETVLQVWDARTGQPRMAPARWDLWDHQQGPDAFSPDGRRVLSVRNALGKDGAPDTGQVQLLDTAGGRALGPVIRLPGRVKHVSFSPDGSRFVTTWGTTLQGEARVWDANTGRPLGDPLRHDGGVFLAAFRRDGQVLVTTSAGASEESPYPGSHQSNWDGPYNPPYRYWVRLWDVATSRAITGPIGQDFSVSDARITGDGRFVITGHLGPVNSLWYVGPDERPAEDLVKLAQVISGMRLDEEGNLVPLAAVETGRAWDELRRKYATEFARPTREDLLAWHQREAHSAVHDFLEKRWYTAKWHLDRLLKATPGNAWLHFQRAQTAAELGWWDQALADLRQSLGPGDSSPSPIVVHGAIALLQVRAGDLDGYRQTCQTVSRLGEDASWVYTLAPQALSDFSAVLRDLEKEMKRNPADANAHSIYGTVLYRAGRFDAARKALEKAEQLQKNWLDARDRLFLAMTLHRLGQGIEARRHLKEAADEIGKSGKRALSWSQRPELRLLLNEAERLLKPAGPGKN